MVLERAWELWCDVAKACDGGGLAASYGCWGFGSAAEAWARAKRDGWVRRRRDGRLIYVCNHCLEAETEDAADPVDDPRKPVST